MAENRTLVTGADGFIGSHLAEALVRAGCRVRAFVLYNSLGTRGWLDHAAADVRNEMECFAGDVRDPDSVRRAVAGCDTVFHLAALIAIPYSYRAPASYVETNVTGTLNILQAAREHDVASVIHTSTSEVYGSASFVPMTEDHPLQAQSPYAATKIGADQLALSFHRSFGTPVSVIRPFNTFGPRQSARAVIPTVITQLLSGAETIRLGALHPTRDFSYVDDIVAAFIALSGTDAGIGEVINVGSNFEISIGDVVEVIAQAVGRKAVVEREDARVRPANSEVERLRADNGKARKLLHWEPSYGGLAGFRRGIEATVAWFRAPENMSRYTAEGYTL